MSKTVQEYVSQLNPRNFTNNVQKTLFRLLRTNGEWTRLSVLRVPSAARRVRDLRSVDYGAFKVECRRADSVGLRGNRYSHVYRLDPRSVTLARLQEVFG